MAAISSSYNIFFGTASWNDPSIWIGGIVPTASDDVMIQGMRFTLKSGDPDLNPSSYPSVAFNSIPYWPGYRDINVYQETTTGSGIIPANGFPFPQTGSLYTYTNRNALVKIDYKGYHFSGSGQGSVFRSCSVDNSFFNWASASFPNDLPLPSDKGGWLMINSSNFFFQPGVISISGSDQVDIYRVTLQNGGKLHIQDSASIRLRNFIQVNDGELKISGSVTIAYDNPWTGSVGTNVTNLNQVTYISQSSYNFSNIELEGPEVRTNTDLITSSSVGDPFLNVLNSSSFEVGDWIHVGEEEPLLPREDRGFRGEYSFNRTVSSEDESFYVVGKDTNKLYIEKHNGIESKILTTQSATQWIVDEERWNIGDKIVINNQVATITNVEDYDFLLNDYDFTNPTASLANFETNNTRSEYFQGWSLVPGVGLVDYQQNSQFQYRHTMEKTVVRDKVKWEVWLRNIPQGATGSNPNSYSFNNVDSDTRTYFGIFINSELGNDDYLNSIQPSEGVGTTTALYRTYLGVQPSRGFFFLNPRYEPGYSISNSIDLTGCGITRPYLGEYKLGLEYTKGFIRGYINDVQVAEQPVKTGAFWGRNGIFSYSHRLIATRARTFAKCQRITLNVGVTASVGDTFYETGTEFYHPSSSKVTKLSSTITNLLDHNNLAHAYIGTSEYNNTGNFPYIFQTNNTTSLHNNPGTNAGTLLIQDAWNSNRIQLGDGNDNRNITIDLEIPTTFSNAGFIEYFSGLGQNYTQSVFPNSVSGSLDAITWFPITGGIDRRSRIHTDGIRDFNFPKVTYRYVRFTFSGVSNGGTSTIFGNNTNPIRSLFVRNFDSGSNNPRIQVNNASDFNVGDQIVIIPNNQINRHNIGMTQLVPFINQNSGSHELLDYYPDHHTITAISGSVLTLDRIYNKFPLAKGSRVVKVNRGLTLSGSYASGSYRAGQGIVGNYNTRSFFYQNNLKIKNVSFQHTNNALPNYAQFQSIPIMGPTQNTPFGLYIFQGNSLYNNFNYQNGGFFFEGGQFGTNGLLFRKNSIYNIMNGLTNIFAVGNDFGQASKIFTGNVVTNNTGFGNNRFSYVNCSHNLFGGADNLFGGAGVTTGASGFARNGYSSKWRYLRNLGMSVLNMHFTFNANSNIYERPANIIVKNNKVQASWGWAGSGGFSPDWANDEILWPERGGSDQKSAYNSLSPVSQWTVQTYTGMGDLVEAGLPTYYIKNFNRWRYDIWTTFKGYFIKFYDLDNYRYYPVANASMNNLGIQYALWSAGAEVNTATTSSFTINFDYFQNIDQIAQLNFFTTMSLGTNLFPQERDEWVRKGNDAGALFLVATKNGKSILPNEIPYEIIPKSKNFTTYTKTFTFEGEGSYYIWIGTAAARGYLEFKNLDSTFKTPSENDAYLTHNSFTMKNFTSNEDKTIRKATSIYGNPEQKFRLKGAKLF